MQHIWSLLSEEARATVELARELLGQDDVNLWLQRGLDKLEEETDVVDALDSKTTYLAEQLPYVNQTLEQFAGDPENWNWLSRVAYTVGAWNPTDADELVSALMYKFVVCNHIEKYNPLESSFKYHIYRAARTTWITALSKRSRNPLAKAVPISNKSPDDPATERGLSVGHITNVTTCDGEVVMNPETRPPVISGDDPSNMAILREELERFLKWLDEVEPGIKASKRHTRLSEVWGWYWKEHLTLSGGEVLGDGEDKVYIRGLCDEAVVQPSTMRRYFDRMRYRFILRFGIDLPHRLWSNPEDLLLYGRKAYTGKNTAAFVVRWRRDLFEKVLKGQKSRRSVAGSDTRARKELATWDPVAEKLLLEYKRSLEMEIEKILASKLPENHTDDQKARWHRQAKAKVKELRAEIEVTDLDLEKVKTDENEPRSALSRQRALKRQRWGVVN